MVLSLDDILEALSSVVGSRGCCEAAIARSPAPDFCGRRLA